MAISVETKWPSSKIGDLCSVSRGSSPRPIADQRYFEGGCIPWIKIADATKSEKFLYETKQYINGYGASFSKLLPAGTIIVAASGTLGYTQILGVPGCAHDGWLILTNLKNFDRDYAYYVLQQMQRHFYNSAYGAAIQNINTDILRETEIPCPPLPTQRKIATILSAYDDLIENNLRRIKILEEIAQNLFREWFVKFRFPGHQHARFTDSPLGRIPEGWEVKALGEVATITMGLSPKGDTYNEKGDGTPLVNGPVEFGGRFTKQVKWTTSPTKLCREGDLIVCVRGSTTGRYVKSNGVYCLGRGVCGLSSNYQCFVDQLFANELDTLLKMTSGSTFPSWTGPQLKSHRVLLPPPELRARFEAIAKPMSVTVLQYSRINTILGRTRDLLLPRLISGEVDVSELDIAVPEEIAT